MLDPRFKDGFFDADRLYSVYHRLTLLCSKEAHPIIVETVTHERTEPLTQLPIEMDIVAQQSVSDEDLKPGN